MDFDVLVFTKATSYNKVLTPYVAWKILRGQTNVSFVYPADVQAGANYSNRDQEVTAGPFDTYEGSTWE